MSKDIIIKELKKIANYMSNGCNMDICHEDNHFSLFCTNQCACYMMQQARYILSLMEEDNG